ncbi:MAG: hypothetical protein Ct9H300mP1_10510 [Planctomycetaceae bacterium]|nr:MAG: hypothetical protein Ct9H300mP1_10510 [Planctomycetaceae bacterium]
MFIYHFEAISRNHLGYDHGLEAVPADPIYRRSSVLVSEDPARRGTIDFADMIYVRSKQMVLTSAAGGGADWEADYPILSGQGGGIAKANRSKAPLYMLPHLNGNCITPWCRGPEGPGGRARPRSRAAAGDHRKAVALAKPSSKGRGSHRVLRKVR